MATEWLFRQTRVGLHGVLFDILKLRTVDPSTGRVSRLALFLRRWRIDEFPQVVNIARRQMNLVGPRPLIPEREALLPPALRERRVQLRPGWLSPSHTILGPLLLEDVVNAELEYLDSVQKHGRIRTDFRVVRRILVNVVFRGARGRTGPHMLPAKEDRMPQHGVLRTVVNRLNSRSFTMALAFSLCVAGFFFIGKGTSGSGVIDIKAAVLQGRLESGSLGLFFVFGGVLLALAAIVARPRSELTIEVAGVKFEYSGYISIERMDRIQRLTQELVGCRPKTVESNPPEPALGSSAADPTQAPVASQQGEDLALDETCL
jgi:hypothetical protein